MNPPSTEAASRNLAKNLRYLRERHGISQAALSKRAKIPRSTLANLEVQGGNPTLAVLLALSRALQVSLEELLSAPRGLGRLYPRGSLPTERRGKQVEMRHLLPDPIPGMEISRLELGPHGRMGGSPHRPGTREYLYCEAGQVILRVAGERFELSEGDVCAFRGDLPHSYDNPGEGVAVALGVVTLAL